MVRPDQLIIFGASGDLTARKLIPALLHNFVAGALPRPIQVIGVSRSERTSEAWREGLRSSLPPALAEAFVDFAPRLHWVRADVAQRAQLQHLHEVLDRLAGPEPDTVGRLYYLALAPQLFGPVVACLDAEGMLTCAPDAQQGWRRVVVEKPFGTDLPSARALNQELLSYLREDQLFRIDHYLGKETVQNLLSFRFQNTIFEPLWTRQHVESVEISVCETVAMEGRRGAYYMVQDHRLQILARIAMEPPGSLQADDVRNEKVKVFRALRQIPAEQIARDVVRAQYAAGPARDRGYLEEEGVAPGSETETYVAIRAAIDTWRWSGVPFLLRTGKALHKRFTEVVLNFRTPPIDLSGPAPTDACPLRPNTLRLRIQPHEGVVWSFLVKEPGAGMEMRMAELGFDYADLGVSQIPDAYQRLLLDALEGTSTLFLRGDEVEAAWSFIDTIRAGWEATDAPIHTYPAGSPGPEPADALFHGCEGSWSYGP